MAKQKLLDYDQGVTGAASIWITRISRVAAHQEPQRDQGASELGRSGDRQSATHAHEKCRRVLAGGIDVRAEDRTEDCHAHRCAHHPPHIDQSG